MTTTDLARDPVVVDWLKQGSPLGPVSYQVKAYIIREYARRYGLEVLVETGSHDGKNLELLADHFAEIHSIELSPDYHELCVRRLAIHRHIHLHHGDSAEVLPRVLELLVDRPALVYLDAHYMGEGTALGSAVTPVAAEMAALDGRRDVIVIDDVEEFHINPDYPGPGWILSACPITHAIFHVGNEYVLLPGGPTEHVEDWPDPNMTHRLVFP